MQQLLTSASFCLPSFDALVLKTISGFCSVCVFRYPTLRPLSEVVLKLGKQPMFWGLSLSLLGLPQGRGQGPVPQGTAVSRASHVPRGRLKEAVQGTSVQDGGVAQRVCLQQHHRKQAMCCLTTFYDITMAAVSLGNENFQFHTPPSLRSLTETVVMPVVTIVQLCGMKPRKPKFREIEELV